MKRPYTFMLLRVAATCTDCGRTWQTTARHQPGKPFRCPACQPRKGKGEGEAA